MSELKKFFIKTYGCQMNELDSEIMVGQLEQRGMTRTDDENAADLLLFNTCSIRDLAERKVLGKLGRLGRTLSKKEAMIGVTGCMANAKKEAIFDKIPHVDFVLGTNNIHQLNEVIDQVVAGKEQVIHTDETFFHELDYTKATRDDPVKAHVSIIRGCDKFCTYCVVPYTRGPEVSRAPEHILAECKSLIDKGYKEITLLGQNVNSYGKDQPGWSCRFHDLLYQLDALPGLERIRFMTSHPVDITYELMCAIRDLPRVCEFVHFPLQAGSNRILRKMHRIYTVEEYLEKVQKLRELVPHVALGTDIIVGFPTETDAEFEETYHLLEKLEFSVAFLFAYSPRKGTPAMRWKDDIAETVKQERLQRLLTLQEGIYTKQRHAFLGKTVEVLVECQNFKDDTRVKGRTRCWKNVLFPGSSQLVGTLQRVTIDGFNHHTLLGHLS